MKLKMFIVGIGFIKDGFSIGWMEAHGIKGYRNDIGNDVGYNTYRDYSDDKVKVYYI